MFCQITIVVAESVRASALEIRFEAEKIGVEIRMQMTPRWMSPKPGRMMIMAPMKPTMTAIQRRSRTFSERNSAAPIVTKIGPVKPSAVISARVVSGSATNHSIMPAVWMAPRATCREPPRVQRAVEAKAHYDRHEEQRAEEIAQERHHVGIEMLRRDQREDVEQGEQDARESDPENPAQIRRQREPAGNEGGHGATMSHALRRTLDGSAASERPCAPLRRGVRPRRWRAPAAQPDDTGHQLLEIGVVDAQRSGMLRRIQQVVAAGAAAALGEGDVVGGALDRQIAAILAVPGLDDEGDRR